MNINDNLAREILMSHADTLAAGHDVTETLATRYSDIAALLRLARDVDSVLAMVPVSAEFRQTVLSNLLQTPIAGNPVPAGVEDSAERNGWLIGAGVALGSAATGVAVWGLRRFMSEDELVEKPSAAPAQ